MTILSFFVVLPTVSILIEWAVRPQRRDLLLLIGRWIVFWAVGIRLFTAGLSQAMRPEYTAEVIFDVTSPVVLPFIQELGFANLALGLVAIVSVLKREWVAPAALAGAMFFGLAGLRHALVAEDATGTRIVALASDLFIFAVLTGYLLRRGIRSRSRARGERRRPHADEPAPSASGS
ncbi:DUF6790 family protein [Pseudactinotalea sp. HY158]|uniref:DUF6790 family protein n=1 Tax=Pseudactinotalea sp. HY158 TaxID=2654547 RepID=UPI00129C4E95|nr:DUF6790 family protein [Pseudactinotalea sp. HY158]QGH69007.1 hypothetical protein GCE65_05425 [Pseudactinotalea sp. HY158]